MVILAHKTYHISPNAPQTSLKMPGPRKPSNPSATPTRAHGSAVHPFWTMVLAVHMGVCLVAPSTAPGVLGKKLLYSPVLDGEASAIGRSPLEDGARLQEAIQTW